jgi:hypothetical protein
MQHAKWNTTRHRYLVHLFTARDDDNQLRHYVLRMRSWGTRPGINAESYERIFPDECELIETINRFLPEGSDVRDVFSHVESPEGFFYVLNLNRVEAAQLGRRLL